MIIRKVIRGAEYLFGGLREILGIMAIVSLRHLSWGLFKN